MRYIAEKMFMVRIPLYSETFINKLLSDKEKMKHNIAELVNDKCFMEGIAIASPNLFERINKEMANGRQIFDNHKLLNSLLKYIIRASTRTTPFGLFCGFGMGRIENRTRIKVKNRNAYSKRARADMQWINGIIKNIEKNYKERGIVFYKNDLPYCKGDRITNPYICYDNMDFGKALDICASIKKTNNLVTILDWCKEGMDYNKLCKLIKENWNLTEEENNKVVKRYVNTLIENDYLISEFRFPKSNIKPLEYIIDLLEKKNIDSEMLLELKEICCLIEKYNMTELGNGIQLILDIENRMKKLFVCKNYLQVDMKHEVDICTLNKCVIKDCEDIANKIISLSRVIDDYAHIREYKERFIEKYGTYVEVPVLELLDNELGLGAPRGYTLPKSEYVYRGKEKDDRLGADVVYEYFFSKIFYACYSGKDVVELTDDDFTELERILSVYKLDNEKVPATFDMNFHIYAGSTDEIDKGNYSIVVGSNVGADRAGRTLGRFSDMLNEDEYAFYDSLYYRAKEQIEDEYILAEIVEEPLSSRVGNIVLNKNSSNIQTAIGNRGNKDSIKILLSDLVIGIDNITHRFYIKSKKYNKKIKYTVFNMLNPVGASNVYRFLREISSAGDYNFVQFIHGLNMEKLPFIPQIRYKKCILVPKTWKLTSFVLKNPKNFLEFTEELEKWRNAWRVPSRLIHKCMDDMMPVDLENEFQLENLYKDLCREKVAILVDYESENNAWITNDYVEKFFGEFVISFYDSQKNDTSIAKKNMSVISLNSNIELNKCPTIFSSQDRVLYPGNEDWWYFKLYCSGIEMDRIIGSYLVPILVKYIQENKINTFYYIRYADPEIHIRLRIKVCKEYTEEILNFVADLQSKAIVKTVSIHRYERELERYGGKDCIEYAENLFYIDSIFAGTVLKRELSDIEKSIIGVIDYLCIINHFNISFQTAIKVIENHYGLLVNEKKYFSQNSKLFIELARCIENRMYDNIFEIIDTVDDIELKKIISDREIVLNAYYKQLLLIDESRMLTNSMDDILLSILHMSSNRLNSSRAWEIKIIELTYRSLYAYVEYKKIEKKRMYK